MEFWNTAEVVQFFRETREKKGFTQEEITEPGLSVATVSNAENPKVRVSEQKARRYCEKIGLDFDAIPELMKKRKKSAAPALKMELTAIETLIDCVDPKEGKQALDKLHIPADLVDLRAYYYYLLGRSLGKISSWKKAEKAFFEAIWIIDEHPQIKKNNIQAACYHELGRCAFWQNNLQQAYQYTKTGLSCLSTSEQTNKIKQPELKYILQISYVIYARLLGQTGAAQEMLQKMWKNIDFMNTEIKLNMAVEQAQLYNKDQMYTLSIACIHSYLDLARKEEKYDRLMELWLILGTTYKQIGKLQQAKVCLKTAEKLQSKVKNQVFTGYTYIELGRLYFDEGDLEHAKQVIEKGIKLCKKDVIKYAYGLYCLGECLEQTDPKTSISLYEKALHKTEQYNFEQQQRKILLRLTNICENIDSVKYHHYLDAYYRLSLKLEGGIKEGSKMNISHINERKRPGDPPAP